ncbi:MAG: hypothetical protein H0U23_07885 [Blastocatellia bacterium]|nr:hypothetical protein [Blastocatellia bacterium]
MTTSNFQQFSVLQQHVNKARANFALIELSDAFPLVVLPLVVEVDEDEVEDSITDSSFQNARGKPAGHDRGTDAIVI